jgi:hypothetical protein
MMQKKRGNLVDGRDGIIDELLQVFLSVVSTLLLLTTSRTLKMVKFSEREEQRKELILSRHGKRQEFAKSHCQK